MTSPVRPISAATSVVTNPSSESCGTQPKSGASSRLRRRTKAGVTVPDTGRMSPPSTARAVDLPAPLGPTTAVRDPGSSARSSPLRARVRWVPRRVRVTRSTVTSSATTDELTGRTRRARTGTSRGSGAGRPGIQSPSIGGAARNADDGAVEGQAAAGQHDHAVDVVEPRLEPVLDDDQRPTTGHVEHGVAHRRGVVGVEHRRRLVEQQHVRTQGQHAGQGESLPLASGQRGGEVVAAVRQPHRLQRLVDALPDLVARQGEVLRPERDVASDAIGDDGVVRVLRQETEPPVDLGLARHLAGDGGAERTGEGVQQRRLAGTAGAEEQHPLAGRDLEVEVADRPVHDGRAVAR